MYKEGVPSVRLLFLTRAGVKDEDFVLSDFLVIWQDIVLVLQSKMT